MVNLTEPLMLLTYAVCALLVIVYLNIRYRPKNIPQYNFEMKNASALIPGLGHVLLQNIHTRNLGIITSELVASLKAAGINGGSLERMLFYMGIPLIEYRAQTEKGSVIFYNTDCIITSPEQLNNAYTIVDFDARSDFQAIMNELRNLNREIKTREDMLEMAESDHFSASNRLGAHVKELRKQIGGGGMTTMPVRATQNAEGGVSYSYKIGSEGEGGG